MINLLNSHIKTLLMIKTMTAPNMERKANKKLTDGELIIVGDTVIRLKKRIKPELIMIS